jgi:uncharacterized protein
MEKIYKRKIVDEVTKYLDSGEAIVIYGARQVGKTSLLRYLMENKLGGNSFYLDLEMPGLLELCKSGPEEVYNYLVQKGADEKRRIFLLVDEIQYLDDPAKFIKLMHDHFKGLKLIVSGSSTFEIKKKFSESLAGRTVNFELWPLSFEEFLLFKEKGYRLSDENSDKINSELVPLAKEFIRFGGYPKIVLENSEEKKLAFLSQIISTYVRKDIRDIGNIRDISGFNKLVEVLASQSGQLLNVFELSNTLGKSQEAVKEWLDLLENTFIIRRVTPFHKNLRSELTKNPKVFLVDTGMMHLLWLKEFPKVILGSSFETFVAGELVKAGKRFNFWRTTNKQEVDFVISGKEICGVEVKVKFQRSRTLEFFEKEYGCKTFSVGLEGRKSGKYAWELLKSL